MPLAGRLLAVLPALLLAGSAAAGSPGSLDIAIEVIAADDARVRAASAPPPGRDPVDAPADALPDGHPAHGTRNIRTVWLVGQTSRYAHGVLGDAVEAGGLEVLLADGRRLRLELGRDSVFEDLTPRLADLDGDGRDEIIVVRSYLDRGAALAVYGVVGGRLALLAETAPIGRPNRWLNPVGAADLDGDGTLEIAYVETPHIGGTLRIVVYDDGRLVERASLTGFSNHAIGSRALGLSALLDLDGDGLPDMIVPDAGRRALRVLAFDGARLVARATFDLPAPAAGDFVAGDRDGDGRVEVAVPLADGRVALLGR